LNSIVALAGSNEASHFVTAPMYEKRHESVPFFILTLVAINYCSIIIFFVIVMPVFAMPAMAAIIVMFILIIHTAFIASFTITAYCSTGRASNRTANNGAIATSYLRANRSTRTAPNCTTQYVISHASIRSAG
jgi:threonine/homoserine/homoserine lactone efflux protein